MARVFALVTLLSLQASAAADAPAGSQEVPVALRGAGPVVPAAAPAAARGDARASATGEAVPAEQSVDEGNATALELATLGSGHCPGYCAGSSMCTGYSAHACRSSIFGCTWKCQWSGKGGVCTGGSMCTDYHDASSCETSIFGCKWGSECPGHCSGGFMCDYKSQGQCVNSIFGCSWKCEQPKCKGQGEKCGCVGCPTAPCCGFLECRGVLGGSDMFCDAWR